MCPLIHNESRDASMTPLDATRPLCGFLNPSSLPSSSEQDAVESSRMATIVGQEARAEGSRMAKMVNEMQEQIEQMESKVTQAKGPDAETQALTARLKRDMEVLLQKTEVVQAENEQLSSQLSDMQQSNLFLRSEVDELKQRLEAGDEITKVRFLLRKTSHTKKTNRLQYLPHHPPAALPFPVVVQIGTKGG